MIKAMILKRELSVDELIREVAPEASREGHGALVAFVGFVKGVVSGETVTELHYESYEELVERKLLEIAKETASKYGAHDVIIAHRVGSLKPGETTVYIIVTARSRKIAFEAAAYALERVKHEAPIYKLERRSDGEYWVIGDGKRIPRKGA